MPVTVIHSGRMRSRLLQHLSAPNTSTADRSTKSKWLTPEPDAFTDLRSTATGPPVWSVIVSQHVEGCSERVEPTPYTRRDQHSASSRRELPVLSTEALEDSNDTRTTAVLGSSNRSTGTH